MYVIARMKGALVLSTTTIALACTAVPAFAADEADSIPELITDRPDQTESSAVVPRGYLQLETGFTYTEAGSRSRTLEYPGTLLRIGLTEGLELRLGTTGFIAEFEPTDTTDFGDSEIGAKIYLWEEQGKVPEAALLASISVPTGESGVSSERFDPAFRFSFSHNLTERVGLGYNLGAAWESVPSPSGRSTLSVFEYTLATGFDINDRLGSFIELFGSAPLSANDDPEVSVDGGATYLLRPNLQLDVAVGAGLNDNAPDWFLTSGVSVLFGR